jgi:HEAT repeat protein
LIYGWADFGIMILNRRWSTFGVLVMGIALFAWGILSWVSRAPTYQGKSAGEWFAEFARAMNAREETASLNALRALGPATVPVLLNAVRAKDTGLKRFELFIWTQLPAIIKSRLSAPIPAAQRRARAYFVLAEIDPDSDDALRALLQGLKDPSQLVRLQCAGGLLRIPQSSPQVDSALMAACHDSDPLVRDQAATTLRCVGSKPEENRRIIVVRSQANLSYPLPFYFTGITSGELSWKSVPQLAKDLKRPNREYRYVATLALRERGLAAREALPVLIESLNDPYYLVRMGVVKTLGQLGSEAKPAVPALTRLLEETSDEQLRRALVRALQNIEPGNARQTEEQ